MSKKKKEEEPEDNMFISRRHQTKRNIVFGRMGYSGTKKIVVPKFRFEATKKLAEFYYENMELRSYIYRCHWAFTVLRDLMGLSRAIRMYNKTAKEVLEAISTGDLLERNREVFIEHLAEDFINNEEERKAREEKKKQ